MSDKIQLLSLSDQELLDFVLNELHESKFRAGQIRQWLNRGVEIAEMSNLSNALREKMAAIAVANPVRIRESYKSKIDETEKFLYELHDGNLIEGVVMRYKYGDTLCVSTQVGCRMGCAFCASTLEGRVRNLTPGEILGQVVAANRHIQATGLNISIRNISLSTCGLVNRIYDFIKEGLPLTLSLSLHAPNDAIRQKIMPVANAYPYEDVIAACRKYSEETGRRVVFEYALIRNVNCEVRHAEELARRLRGMRCHVNLIPLNAVKERNLEAPTKQDVAAFLKRLELKNISATVRREMGADIDGACGQLRRKYISEQK